MKAYVRPAVVTGINGQDGFYLTKLLLEKGYTVVGVYRRTSSSTAWRLVDLPDYDQYRADGKLILEAGDITDFSSISRIVHAYQPKEFYNLAAQSQVWHSFKSPISTLEITGVGAGVCMEAVFQFAPKICRFYQAGSSEQFGNSAIFGKDDPEEGVIYERILNEESPMLPRSPYGCAKLMAHALVRNYRERGMYTVGGILFNHESPYRGIEFVTRKITAALAKIVAGEQDGIELGNLDAYRDWGHSEDYMRAAWMMMQQEFCKEKDYVIATGKTNRISDFLQVAFGYVGIKDWQSYVQINPEFVRPSEVDVLIGDASKARAELGWAPKHSFNDLVYEMVYRDCLRKGVVDQVLPREKSETNL